MAWEVATLMNSTPKTQLLLTRNPEDCFFSVSRGITYEAPALVLAVWKLWLTVHKVFKAWTFLFFRIKHLSLMLQFRRWLLRVISWIMFTVYLDARCAFRTTDHISATWKRPQRWYQAWLSFSPVQAEERRAPRLHRPSCPLDSVSGTCKQVTVEHSESTNVLVTSYRKQEVEKSSLHCR